MTHNPPNAADRKKRRLIGNVGQPMPSASMIRFTKFAAVIVSLAAFSAILGINGYQSFANWLFAAAFVVAGFYVLSTWYQIGTRFFGRSGRSRSQKDE